MRNHIQWLKSQNVKFDTIWMDIETCSGCWNDHASNTAFIRDLVEGAASAGAKVGSKCFVCLYVTILLFTPRCSQFTPMQTSGPL